MSARHAVGMHTPHRNERAEQGHAALAAALAEAEVGEPDADGMFEIALEAPDREAALERVWNAVAAAGADDHIVFAEHPDVPEHWRPG
jgi:hypothetical protein